MEVREVYVIERGKANGSLTVIAVPLPNDFFRRFSVGCEAGVVASTVAQVTRPLPPVDAADPVGLFTEAFESDLVAAGLIP